MKPFLLHEQQDTGTKREIPNEKELIQDFNLDIIFKTMAKNDIFLYDTAKRVILSHLTDTGTILYRQDVLRDCIEYRSAILELYGIAAEAVREAAYYREFSQPSYTRIVPPSERVQKSLGLLEVLISRLEEVKALCARSSGTFHSKGLIEFCSRQIDLLSEDFFSRVKGHMDDLKALFLGGRLVIGSQVGNGMKGARHVLRRIEPTLPATGAKRKSPKINESNTITLENISMANSAREIEDAGLVHILRVINHFTRNITAFFESLRYEAGFYTGCVNLYNTLTEVKAPICFPVPGAKESRAMSFKGLYDASMAATEYKRLVTNDLDAGDTRLFIITGANQGGKSTFLRSVGLAHIFMQCGMFVPADYFCANVCDHVFTHFTREEDEKMNSGKLEEELLRMNRIISTITPGSILFMNESFATTTERDGAGIAKDIITALHEHGIKVFFVTHLYEFAKTMYDMELEGTVFLRAERNDNGSRSYRIECGKPLQTSFGEDLFHRIMGSPLSHSCHI